MRLFMRHSVILIVFIKMFEVASIEGWIKIVAWYILGFPQVMGAIHKMWLIDEFAVILKRVIIQIFFIVP